MELIRVCIFRPYRKGHGPSFTLQVYDTFRTDHYGKSVLGYQLRQSDQNGRTLFTGEDFACSPMHAIDSDDCIASLMGFLTLRPGDTDQEYFDSYTAAQLEYTSNHAESLGCEVTARFGEA